LHLQTLHISNIFHDEKNFRWMYLFVRQVLRIKNIEESLFYGHLIDALSKAMSVLDEVGLQLFDIILKLPFH
jgi:hypothetical protein